MHEAVKLFHSYININVHSLVLKLMKGGAHAASCLGILGSYCQLCYFHKFAMCLRVGCRGIYVMLVKV